MQFDYKTHATLKAVVGVAPSGELIFSFSVFPGSISDKHIAFKSRLLNRQMQEPDEELMNDQGFTIEDYLSPLGENSFFPEREGAVY